MSTYNKNQTHIASTNKGVGPASSSTHFAQIALVLAASVILITLFSRWNGDSAATYAHLELSTATSSTSVSTSLSALPGYENARSYQIDPWSSEQFVLSLLVTAATFSILLCVLSLTFREPLSWGGTGSLLSIVALSLHSLFGAIVASAVVAVLFLIYWRKRQGNWPMAKLPMH